MNREPVPLCLSTCPLFNPTPQRMNTEHVPLCLSSCPVFNPTPQRMPRPNNSNQARGGAGRARRGPSRPAGPAPGSPPPVPCVQPFVPSRPPGPESGGRRRGQTPPPGLRARPQPPRPLLSLVAPPDWLAGPRVRPPDPLAGPRGKGRGESGRRRWGQTPPPGLPPAPGHRKSIHTPPDVDATAEIRAVTSATYTRRRGRLGRANSSRGVDEDPAKKSDRNQDPFSMGREEI